LYWYNETTEFVYKQPQIKHDACLDEMQTTHDKIELPDGLEIDIFFHFKTSSPIIFIVIIFFYWINNNFRDLTLIG